MARRSKKEQRLWDNALLLYSVVEKLNALVDYVFIGVFANLAHNHFRSNSMFELLVDSSSVDKAYSVFDELGFNPVDKENVKEFCSEDMLIRVWISNDRLDFEDRKQCVIHAFNLEYAIYFPSLEVHKRYLGEYANNIAVRDIALLDGLEEEKRMVFNIDNSFELYLVLLSMGDKHNHINGSDSCRLCKNWIREGM